MLGINKTHNTGSTIKSVGHFITQSINSRPGPPHTYLAILHTSQSSPAALRMSKGDSRPCGPDSRVPAAGPATLTLRISSYRLAIETGRYTRPITPKNERFCNNCYQLVVGDEFNFLLTCHKFTSQRKTFDKLSTFCNINNNNDFATFYKLMSYMVVVIWKLLK